MGAWWYHGQQQCRDYHWWSWHLGYARASPNLKHHASPSPRWGIGWGHCLAGNPLMGICPRDLSLGWTPVGLICGYLSYYHSPGIRDASSLGSLKLGMFALAVNTRLKIPVLWDQSAFLLDIWAMPSCIVIGIVNTGIWMLTKAHGQTIFLTLVYVWLIWFTCSSHKFTCYSKSRAAYDSCGTQWITLCKNWGGNIDIS
jgi:hypothetical protein